MTRAIELTIKLIVEALPGLPRRKACSNKTCFVISRLALLLVGGLFLHPGSALGLDPYRSLDQFSYQTWQTGSGLPQNTARSILQTHDGFLWLATEGGLVRFDGYQFTVFDSRNTPALKSDNIRAISEDQQGTLWIATAEGICRLKEGAFEQFGSRPEANTLALRNGDSGDVWAVTPNSLVKLRATPERVPSEKFSLGEGAPGFTGAIAAGRGMLWAGTERGLKVLRNGGIQDASGNLPAAAVNALMVDSARRLWVGTAKGLFVSATADFLHFSSVSLGAFRSPVLSLFKDWEGAVWAGTEDGLVRLSNKTFRTLAGNSIISMAEDAEGDLWIGTESQGVTVIRNQKFVTYTTRDGLISDAVRCIFESQSGTLSIGTNAGLTQLNNGRFTQVTARNGLSSDVILSLGEDRNGNLLAGTPDGLNLLRGGSVSVTTSADGLADDFVRSIYRDSDGSLWIGTRHGLSHETAPASFITYTQSDGLGSDLVGAIERDSAGNLWVATLNGLSRFRGNRFSTYRMSDGLSSNVVTALYPDAEGGLWIGTQNAGLNFLSGGKIFRLPAAIGLPEGILGIVEDANGELWLSSNNGIVRANKNELKSAAVGRTTTATAIWYGTSDGLRINECSSGGHPEVWKGHDGTLWFSTVKGLAALYPDAAHLNRVIPPVVIESVTVDDRTLSPSELNEVKPGHSRFSFTYAGLSFAAPQKVVYRYKLDGFDKDWIDAGTQRTAYYTNIPPGRYRFRVLARNNDGFWNDAGGAVGFRLEPHFYQTIWFYVLIAIALAGASYFVYAWRVAEVEARFRAVLQERNRIAREIHDTLAQGYVAVSMQLEIVSRALSSSTESAREHLDQARVLVRESLLEARQSIWQLRSQGSESGDLASRLSKAAQQAIGSNPVKLILEVHGTYRPLPQAVEDELLRIGQEAVMNAIRHADPAHINIDLKYTTKKLNMTIADDGRGFAMGSYSTGPNGHFGLQGMHERAKQIKAGLVVDSAVGKGTRISVEAPLQ